MEKWNGIQFPVPWSPSMMPPASSCQRCSCSCSTVQFPHQINHKHVQQSDEPYGLLRWLASWTGCLFLWKLFLSFNAITKSRVLCVFVWIWMVELYPGYVSGLWFVEFYFWLLDFNLLPWTSSVISLFPYLCMLTMPSFSLWFVVRVTWRNACKALSIVPGSK